MVIGKSRESPRESVSANQSIDEVDVAMLPRLKNGIAETQMAPGGGGKDPSKYQN